MIFKLLLNSVRYTVFQKKFSEEVHITNYLEYQIKATVRYPRTPIRCQLPTEWEFLEIAVCAKAAEPLEPQCCGEPQSLLTVHLQKANLRNDKTLFSTNQSAACGCCHDIRGSPCGSPCLATFQRALICDSVLLHS